MRAEAEAVRQAIAVRKLLDAAVKADLVKPDNVDYLVKEASALFYFAMDYGRKAEVERTAPKPPPLFANRFDLLDIGDRRPSEPAQDTLPYLSE